MTQRVTSPWYPSPLAALGHPSATAATDPSRPPGHDPSPEYSGDASPPAATDVSGAPGHVASGSARDASWRAIGERDASPLTADPTALDLSPGSPRRICRWCLGPIPAGARRDAVHCRKGCRQSHHRIARGRQQRVASGLPLRLAYADPPYPGMAQRYYADHPDFGGEVDHAELIPWLVQHFPDGWALSTSAAALQTLLALCPPAVRVAAWFRGERPTMSYRPLVAWEPVIYLGGRAYATDVTARRLDALVHVARPRRTDPKQIVGAKPAEFCWWMFDLLGALPGDTLYDLFPGSGGITRAWDLYQSGPLTDPSRGAGYARRVATAGSTPEPRQLAVSFAGGDDASAQVLDDE